MTGERPIRDTDWPKGLSQPALRALTGASIQNLEQLRNWKEKDIAALHGMGP